MGFFDFLFGKKEFDTNELCKRLGMSIQELHSTPLDYKEFCIKKRNGSLRRLFEPNPELKKVQRKILHKLLSALKANISATGFETGESIVSNAAMHADKAFIIKMDIKNFFSATSKERIYNYFRKIGWNSESANILTELCTHNESLPQGAPTSPRLSNLVNYLLDERLEQYATFNDLTYTRYADDITFSGETDEPEKIKRTIATTKKILRDFNYRSNQKKLRVCRQNVRQIVTGLVVNKKVQLPRETRKWLRAIEHRAASGKPITLSEKELNGWRSLQKMISSYFTQANTN